MRALVLVLVLSLASTALADDLVADGRPIDRAALLEQARAARVVFVGEEHGTASHHLLQRDLLQALDEAGPVLLVCEYFPRSLQPVLDELRERPVADEDLPRALRWKETWGHDWAPYAPLFELANRRRIPIVAANAEKELVTRVRKEGLPSFSVEELLRLPRMDLRVETHRDRVRRQLQAVHPMPEEMLQRFYEAFTLWDETMAESLCEAVLRDGRPGVRVLFVAGIAHVQTGSGVPDRVLRRWPTASRLIVACGDDVEPADGDVLFVTKPAGRWY
jgi:uncharacterized iron-regulated protein